MTNLLTTIAAKHVKPTFTEVKVGDSVRVYTTVKEGEKTRTQYFEGLVIRRRGGIGSSATFTVRRIASGVGVERVFPLHSPTIQKIAIQRGAKVRRAQLHYMRDLSGKAARLKEVPVKQKDRETEHPWAKSAGITAAPVEEEIIKSTPKTDAEKAAEKADKPAETKPEVKPEAKAAKPEAKAEAKTAKPESKDSKPDAGKKPDAKSEKK